MQHLVLVSKLQALRHLGRLRLRCLSYHHLKQSSMSAGQEDHETRRIVSQILEDIRVGKEEAVRKYSLEMDGYDGKVIVSNEEIEEACNSLDPQLKVAL